LCGLADHVAARERGAAMTLGDALDLALGRRSLSATGA
jgi:hypothetical protein